MKSESAVSPTPLPATGTLRMYTTFWCADCHRAKWFLKARGVAFHEIRLEDSEEAVEFVLRANHGKRRVPTFELNGRTFHGSPFDPRKLARELGLEDPARS
ncbi:MAG TPA: glutaredoxin family protein [Terriglobia bacterium]|nr:glutaredoxin family protein [Terriglobia bacterium]